MLCPFTSSVQSPIKEEKYTYNFIIDSLRVKMFLKEGSGFNSRLIWVRLLCYIHVSGTFNHFKNSGFKIRTVLTFNSVISLRMFF